MNTVPATISPPPAIASYFLSPPLLSTEGLPQYQAMFGALAATLKPQDEIEWFLMGDYLHHTVQICRWRKAAAALIETMRKDALRAVLETAIEDTVEDRDQWIDGYIDGWFKEGDCKLSVLKILGRRGLDEGHVTAQAMSLRLPELDKVEGMIGDFERRRTAVLRELEYYRIAAFWRAPKELPALIEAAADASPGLATGEAA
jgi:hypothetical protein